MGWVEPGALLKVLTARRLARKESERGKGIAAFAEEKVRRPRERAGE
jgi:hypothetical protein